MFPKLYMPMVQLKDKYIKNSLKAPLSAFVLKGNYAVLFQILMKQLIYCFGLITIVSLLILMPTYLLNKNQTTVSRTIWTRLQISQLDTESISGVIPVICLIVFTVILEKFYSNFYQVYSHYLNIQRNKIPSNQNYTVFVNNIPPKYQTKQKFYDLMHQNFGNQVVKIIPAPINDRKLYWKNYLLKWWADRVQRHSRSVIEYRNRLEYYQYLQQQKLNWFKKQHVNFWVWHNKRWLKIFKRRVNTSHAKLIRDKLKVQEIIEAEKIDCSYLLNSHSDLEQFQKCVDEFQLSKHLNVVNKTRVKNLDYIEQQRKIFIKQHDYQKDDGPIGNSAFVIFKTTEAAALASYSQIIAGKNDPVITQAPPPQQIAWYEINTSKTKQLSNRIVYWILNIILLATYFCPLTIIQQLVSTYSQDWFNWLYSNICNANNDCSENVEITGETISSTGNFGCFLCYEIDSMLFTYLPSLINTIFNSLLPYIFDLLILLYRSKSKNERRNLKYISMYTILFLIQGVLNIIISSSYDENGILNIKLLLTMSFNDFMEKFASSLASSSFGFLNYVMLKYFMFAVSKLIRFSDIFLTIWYFICRRDNIYQQQIYNYGAFQYTTILCYLSHLLSVGCIYMVSSPTVNVIILICLISQHMVYKYQILQVYTTTTNENEFMQGINCFEIFGDTLYVGQIIQYIAMFAYITITYQCQAWVKAIYDLVILILLVSSIINKYQVDKQYRHQKIAHNAKEIKISDYNPDIQDYMLNTASMVRNMSYFYKINQVAEVKQQKFCQPPLEDQNDINAIAQSYTHPAIVHTAIYNTDESNYLVL